MSKNVIHTRATLEEEFRIFAAELTLDMDIFSDGPINADVIFIGEGPGENEVKSGKPFTGSSGRLLWDSVRKYGLHRANVYSTNVVKRQISLSRTGNERHLVLRDELEKWIGLLEWELSQLSEARIVFCLGNYALEAVTGKHGITDWRGSVIKHKLPNGKDGWVVCANNPAYAMREPKQEPVFMLDCQKLDLVNRGAFKTYEIEELINPTFKEAMAFMRDLNKSKEAIALDVEAPQSIGPENICYGLSNDPHKAMCINFIDKEGSRFTLEQEHELFNTLQKLCDSHKIIVQNGGHEIYATWLRDHLKLTTWMDTLLAHHDLYPQLPHNLGFLTAQYTTHPYYKGEYDDWKLSQNFDDLWRYNCLTGDTKVLMADLTWKRLDTIVPGDEIIAPDEHATGMRSSRKLRRSIVSKIAGSKKPVIAVHLSNGEVIKGTYDHQVIKQKIGKRGKREGYEWVQLCTLKANDIVPSITPWELIDSREAGWLSGIFDGEGTFWRTADIYPRVGFSQNSGRVLSKAHELLTRLGFKWNTVNKKGCIYTDIQDGVSGTLRFIGSIKPERLYHKLLETLNEGWGGYNSFEKVYVIHTEYQDDEPVYDITTSTGTFIANGVTAHNCKDAAITKRASQRLLAELQQQGRTDFFFNHTMRAQNHIAHATVHGLAVDTTVKDAIVAACTEDVQAIKNDFYRIVHELIGDDQYYPNPGSPQQMKELFFTYLKLRGKGLSVDKSNRKLILKNPMTTGLEKEMITLLDRYTEENKFNGTFANSRVSPDHRFRTDYKQYGVARAPGRLSSSMLINGEGGNQQNQPLRARGMYITDQPTPYIQCKEKDDIVFCYFDLAQAEARVVAYRANIPKWKEQFERARIDGSYDCHRALASEMFKVPYNETPKDDWTDDASPKPTIRFTAKRCRHGLNYRMERYKLAEVTGLSYHEAARAFTLYHQITPELRLWWEQEEKQFRLTKTQFNALGRRNKIIQRIDEEALETVVAFYPQSTIGDKVVQVWYQAEEDDKWPDRNYARVAINVHDNLVAMTTRKYAKTVLSILKKHAETPLLIQDAWNRKAEKLIIPADLKMSYRSEAILDEKGKIKFEKGPNGYHRWSHMDKVKL